jgi:hypothetical protein
LEVEIAALREAIAADPNSRYVQWLDRLTSSTTGRPGSAGSRLRCGIRFGAGRAAGIESRRSITATFSTGRRSSSRRISLRSCAEDQRGSSRSETRPVFRSGAPAHERHAFTTSPKPTLHSNRGSALRRFCVAQLVRCRSRSGVPSVELLKERRYPMAMCKGIGSDGLRCKAMPRTTEGYCVLCAVVVREAEKGSMAAVTRGQPARGTHLARPGTSDRQAER